MGGLGFFMLFLLFLGTFLTAFYGCGFLYVLIRGYDFNLFSGFNQFDKTLIFSSRILALGAIFRGFFIQTLIRDVNYFIPIKYFRKIIILLRVFMGAVRSLLIFSFVKKRIENERGVNFF